MVKSGIKPGTLRMTVERSHSNTNLSYNVFDYSCFYILGSRQYINSMGLNFCHSVSNTIEVNSLRPKSGCKGKLSKKSVVHFYLLIIMVGLGPLHHL